MTSEAELDALTEGAFGPLPAGAERREPGRLSFEEAQEVVFDSAFDGHGHSDWEVHEARQIVARGNVTEAAMPAASTGQQRVAAVSDLLRRVTTSPGGRTQGFSEAQDRRIDTAYTALWGLAESRLGMPHQEAVDHARRVFLECQHVAAQAQESKNDFISRLEHRVSAYQAMPSLVIESKRAGGR